MKSIQFAIAGALYRKKFTIGLFIFTLISIMLLFFLTNLIDTENIVYQQLMKLPDLFHSEQSHQSILSLYRTLYLLFCIFYGLFTSLLLIFYMKHKKNELQNLHLKGFSTFFLVKQTVLEVLLPLFSAILAAICLTIIFANAYSLLLVDLQSRINEHFHPFHTYLMENNQLITIKNLTPDSADGSNLTFFNLSINSLSNSQIAAALLQSLSRITLLFLILSSLIIFSYVQNLKRQSRR